MELVVNIAKNDLSKNYDRVRYEINNFLRLKEAENYPHFLKKLPRWHETVVLTSQDRSYLRLCIVNRYFLNQ